MFLWIQLHQKFKIQNVICYMLYVTNVIIVRFKIRKTVHFVFVLNNALFSFLVHYLIRKKVDCLSYFETDNIRRASRFFWRNGQNIRNIFFSAIFLIIQSSIFDTLWFLFPLHSILVVFIIDWTFDVDFFHLSSKESQGKQKKIAKLLFLYNTLII